MGSKISRSADGHHPSYTDDESIPLFDKLKLVLIGCHKAGKNRIGNAILGKKAFTHKNFLTKEYLKCKKTIFGRRISVIRVPGWSGDLSSEDNTQENVRQVIKDSVWSFKHGPNAIILVVKKHTELSETTIRTLQTLLGDSVSTHILVASTDGKRISLATISEHYCNKQTIIKTYRNRNRFFWRRTCRKQHMKLIETIEDFMVRKNAIHFCPTGKEEAKPVLQLMQLKIVVNRLIQRISGLSGSISKLHSGKKTETNKLQKNKELKNEEIRKLQDALKQKEEALKVMKEKWLQPNQSAERFSAQHGRITQVEDDGTREDLQRNITKDQRIEQKKVAKKSQNGKKIKYTLKRKPRKQAQRKPWRKTRKRDALELVPLHSAATPIDEEPQAGEGVEFVDRFRADLIERVVSVEPILDEMLQLIGVDKYSKVRQAKTSQEKMRELYIILDGGGQKLKEEFYRSLLKHEEFLVEDLHRVS
ncbi:GTPase IMAP family member 7 isoform X2 [Astyanax mexicanus]|uniref:GTPase IMAP family member 7 isoform X2 n=1 Tax=Astyanax mexicanus TaxID=7994 RepID=UPI000BBDD2F7|nr:GTPase IMAP family member 7 isoform X2 [Astyanax mexicanus]